MPTPQDEDRAQAAAETRATTPRTGYHHGDLRAALVDAAEAVIREQGPEGISMRDLARRAGVTPSAAYRHFAGRNELVQQVTFRAQAASASCMDARRAELPEDADGAAHLMAVGLAYIEYARAEPGLFRAAFLEPEHLDLARDPRSAGPGGLTPYQHLEKALDRMVADGTLPDSLRPGAEAPCWSAVHGFSMLVVQGPLRAAPAPVVDQLAARTVFSAVRGVTEVPPAAEPPIVVTGVVVRDDAGRVLTVRKRGTDRFMLPGGKPEHGEGAAQTGVRELAEEVGLHAEEDALQLLGEFTGRAANEPGHTLVSTVFTAETRGEPRAAAEIAELRWLPLDEEVAAAEVHPYGLAPLLTDHVLPLLRGGSQQIRWRRRD